jgi:hypothetical protein
MCQPLIPRGEKSGLPTRTAATESVSLRVRMKKLTAFIELESAIRAAERLEDCEAREIKLDRLSRIN